MGLRLDLGCGLRCKPGYTGVDISSDVGADVICDLRDAPWPWSDDSIHEVQCFHFLEHLTGPERMLFMDELWRVLVLGGKAYITTPHWSSMRAVQDPTHAWPPICEMSYRYFSRSWREEMKLAHYPLRCNFTTVVTLLLGDSAESDDAAGKLFLIEHTLNTVDDILAVMTKER